MKQRKRWDELNSQQQTMIAVGAVIEIALTTVALVDVARRPRDQVRGPKLAWVAGCFIQPVGPIAYIAFGRRGT